MWWWKRKLAGKNPEKKIVKDALIFTQTVERYDSYSTKTDYICLDNINNLLDDYRQDKISHYPFPTTNYNGKLYAMFDLDELDKYNDFCKNFDGKYVIFQSSPGHHWAFIDEEFETFSDFIKSELINDWIVYTDEKYNTFSRVREYFSIRGWFETLDRQPGLIYESDNLSKNFKEFIDKLENYFQTTSLELSMLKYKNIDLLNIYERIKKLERILE